MVGMMDDWLVGVMEGWKLTREQLGIFFRKM